MSVWFVRLSPCIYVFCFLFLVFFFKPALIALFMSINSAFRLMNSNHSMNSNFFIIILLFLVFNKINSIQTDSKHNFLSLISLFNSCQIDFKISTKWNVEFNLWVSFFSALLLSKITKMRNKKG